MVYHHTISSSLAVVFPGQGSQKVGMLSSLAPKFPIIPTTFSEASQVLKYDLWGLVSNGPEEKLNQTQYTQPAMLVADIALWKCFQEKTDTMPTWLAGHSLGEYAALVAAEAIALSDAVKLVEQRALFMQQAVKEGEGAMAAIIGLPDDKVTFICSCISQEEGKVVEAVNFNSPGQIVMAGQVAAIELAINKAKSEGAKIAKKLPVSVPSHCSLMKPAAEKLSKVLENTPIQSTKIPVIHNADVETHSHPDDIRAALVKQLYQPVQWTKTIERLRKEGVAKILECGPGKVLSGLNRRIDTTLEVGAVVEE